MPDNFRRGNDAERKGSKVVASFSDLFCNFLIRRVQESAREQVQERDIALRASFQEHWRSGARRSELQRHTLSGPEALEILEKLAKNN